MARHGKPRCVCYLLAYREPRYVRSRTILQALAGLPAWQTVTAVNRSRGMARYLEMLWGLVVIRWRLDPQIYILGFRGHEIFWPVRLMTWGRILIFDAMMSPYGALKEEGKHGRIGRLLAGGVELIERGIMRWSDRVLTDTQRHRAWMAKTFQIPEEKLVALPVGAEENFPVGETVPCSLSTAADKPFEILFYGSFLPLHGVDVIVEAARLLVGQPVRFTLIGGHPNQHDWISSAVAQAKGCLEHIGYTSFESLLTCYIPRANLCLGGPFGDTPQAARVVTGKTQQCLAMGKATVVAHGEAGEGFVDRVNVLLVPPANPEALAEVIRWAMAHPDELAGIAQKGQQLYQQHMSVERIRAILHATLAQC
ncbi:MAG: glycosyltransferase family 4 protein [Magnetococcales bacterium]|nr:glycosyltransferase family 4 protein [Magnetococcales bacterium]